MKQIYADKIRLNLFNQHHLCSDFLRGICYFISNQNENIRMKTATLFLTTTIIFLFFGILTENKNVDIQFHDTYFIISYLHIAIIFCLLTGLTGLTYFGLERVKRPIKLKIGYWHFGLFMVGLLLLVVKFNLPTSTGYYNPNNPYSSNIYSAKAILLLISVIFLLISAIIFLCGLTKALFGTK
jgi:heme/copper-type cytochrome/quinol oxidase subunit 1